jgi:site-specific recombinase XerC
VLAPGADRDRNRAMLTLLCRSGLRVSEMTAARSADLKAHNVRILDSKATTRGFHPSADDALAHWYSTRH